MQHLMWAISSVAAIALVGCVGGPRSANPWVLACQSGQLEGQVDPESIRSSCGDLATMTLAEIDTGNPEVLCPRLHYETAPQSVMNELVRLGWANPADVDNMRRSIVLPGMTECDMFIVMGMPTHGSHAAYGKRPIQSKCSGNSVRSKGTT